MITFAIFSPVFALFDVGGGEMILILLVILLLFGGKRMPELARGLGKSINEFKKATSGVEAQLKQAIHDVRETTVTPMRETIASAVTPLTEETFSPAPTPPPAVQSPPPAAASDASPARPEDPR